MQEQDTKRTSKPTTPKRRLASSTVTKGNKDGAVEPAPLHRVVVQGMPISLPGLRFMADS